MTERKVRCDWVDDRCFFICYGWVVKKDVYVYR